MSCTYTYNGKQYSKAGVLRAISQDPSTISKAAMNFLTSKLGMLESEVEVVAGLIDNKALGQFTEDGKILLSGFADDSVVYHEAFHRVFRMFMTPQDRAKYYNEFRKRPNYKSLLDKYRKDYGNNEEDLIEEYLADEFADYMINKGNVKIDNQTRSIFEKIIDFIKKLLGIKKDNVYKLFNKIEKGTFNKRSVDTKFKYMKSAYKVKINNNEYSYEKKNDFVQLVATDFVKQLLQQNSIYGFIDNKFDAESLKAVLDDSFNAILEIITNVDPSFAIDVMNDLTLENSYILSEFEQYIKTIVGNVTITTKAVEKDEVTPSDILSDNIAVEEGSVNEELGRSNDDSNRDFTSSIEIDPKTSMSRAIKLLLSSYLNSKETNSFGLSKQVKWGSAFNKIAQHVAGVPTQDIIKKMSELSTFYPWINDLINDVGGIDPKIESFDQDLFRLRNDLIKTFSNTAHTMLMVKITDEEVQLFDANQNTYVIKKLNEWSSQMQKRILDNGGLDNWLGKVRELVANPTKVTIDQYEQLLGISVNSELHNVHSLFVVNGNQVDYHNALETIAAVIVGKEQFSNTNPPNYKNLFGEGNFDITGILTNLSIVQRNYEDNVDLMVNLMGKSYYTLSQNTHSTNTINTLNYIADLIDVTSSLQTKLEIVQKYLPNILNYQTVKKLNDGSYLIQSEWLKHILDGKKIGLNIIHNVTTERGDEKETSDLNESDLHSTVFNLALKGMNVSIKHSDRTIFYAYDMKMGQLLPSTFTNAVQVVDYLIKKVQEQLLIEKQRANIENAPNIQSFSKVYKKSTLFPDLDITTLDVYSKDIEDRIRKELYDSIKDYKEKLDKWGVTKKATSNKLIGVSDEFTDQFNVFKSNKKNEIDNDSLNFMIATAYANQFLSHLEEMKIFVGDFAFFKTADDFYKRMSTTSGTGNRMVTEDITNDIIAQMNDVEFELLNPRTGKLETIKYDRPVDGTFVSMTVEEESNYFSKDATEQTHESPLDKSKISKIQYVFEWNQLKDLEDSGVTITDEVKKNIRKLSQTYVKNYQSINENDGQSWVNMFFYREYMVRNTLWTDQMNNLFKIELKILNAKSLDEVKDLTIEVDGEQIKVFDWSNWTDTSESLKLFESVHTLKPQYAGFTDTYINYRNRIGEPLKDLDQQVRPYTIFKTSYHALWPSVVIGTNLQQAHHFMLKNKVDVLHMGSANKTGAIDMKKVFESRKDQLNDKQKKVINDGFTFYDEDGYFNDSIFDDDIGADLLSESKSIGFFDSMKDQVKIGAKEKKQIKGSTQSLKNLLSNMYVNGKPRFEGADVLVRNYKNVVNRLVNKAVQELKRELDVDNKDVIQNLNALVKTVKQAAEDRSSPINIIEAIEGFLFNPVIETLPNKSKIENILFSIITNNAVSFNRPGNAYPLVAATGFEALGSRKDRSTGNYVRFYDIQTDAKGIKNIKPAEIVIPLPKEWIPLVLEKTNTTNIIEAIQIVNQQIKDGTLELTVKGLRIPNQSLSSNDMFVIKEFKIPTNVAYAIAPSEIVTKVGSDFDIDKESLYWADSKDYTKNVLQPFNSRELHSYDNTQLYNALLTIEKDILTHPRNAHILLMPVIDDALKNDAYNEIVLDKSNQKTSFLQALTPQKNVEKAIDFIKSKLGVGVVALDITGHSVFNELNVRIPLVVTRLVMITYKGEEIYEDELRHLMFEGMYNNNSLSSMYDANNRLISELQSQTMTSQVDAGKDPYAVLIGINNQTLGPMMYLLRRGVPVTTILMFLSQPLIKQYLEMQRINESSITKQRGIEQKKDDLIAMLYKSIGQDRNKLFKFDALNNAIIDRSNGMSVKDLKTGLELNRPDTEFQYNAFEYFLQVVDETSKFNTLKKGMSVDTKGKKNLAEILDYENTWNSIVKQQIISKRDIDNILNNSVLTPFFKVHDLYRKWYGRYYFLDNLEPFQSLVTRLQDKFLPYLKGGQEARVKFLNTLQNDFLLFLIQNYNDDFSRSSFQKMFGFVENEKSVADMVQEYRKSNPDDYAIKIIYPQKSAQIDPGTDKLTDIVRIFERALSTTDNNDFIDAMHDLRDNNEELYKKLVQISLNQAGFNNSPFTLNKVLPTFKNVVRNKNNEIESSENDYLRQLQLNAIDRFSRLREDDQTRLISSFEDMFYRNNPQFLSNQINAFSYAPYFYVYDNEKQRRIIKDGNYSEVEQLGDFYKKSYFLESGMPTRNMVLNTPNTDLPFDSDPFGFEDKVIPQQRFQGYKGGFENTGKGTPEGDGADKAMRAIANTSITEVVDRTKESSSYTTEKALPWDSNKSISGVVMLARNKELATKSLTLTTKKRIYEANERGAEFIVGDMPNVDSQFIDYLQKIGAKFTIYHTGNTPRIQVNQPTTETINIYAGTGENAELSNFAKRPFKATLGVQALGKFETVEGAFQAAKLLYTEEGLSNLNEPILEQLQTADGKTAKSIGRNIQGLNKEDWDNDSSSIMKELLKQSFEQNSNALAKLLATGNATLTHTQDKGKWGTEFPRLLMEVRDELRGTQLTTQTTTSIKPGVEELFDSNPQLANQVYDALGYKVSDSSIALNKINNTKVGENVTLFINDMPVKYKRVSENYFEGKQITKKQETDFINSVQGATTPIEDFIEKEGTAVRYSLDELVNFYLQKLPKFQPTPQQKQEALQLYSQYLDTVFPDSKVKDILYHGTPNNFEKFDSSIPLNKIDRKSFYFTKNKSLGNNYRAGDGNLYDENSGTGKLLNVILNFKNPYEYGDYRTSLNKQGELSIPDYPVVDEITSDEIKEIENKGYDSVIGYGIGLYNKDLEYVAFEPEQIHILGSKEDIQGFKDFVQGDTTITDITFSTDELTQANDLVDQCKIGGSSSQIKAAKGLTNGFKKGGKWELVEDLKGYPSHAQGGVDIQFNNDGYYFKNNDATIKASCGLCLPSINKKV